MDVIQVDDNSCDAIEMLPVSTDALLEREVTEVHLDGKESSFKGKLARSFSVSAAYCAVALSLGMLGPSLIDLEIQTGAPVSRLSTIFLCRGILAIGGSLALGKLLDRVNLYLVVAVALFCDFILHVSVPWCLNLPSIMTVLSLPEFFNCAIGMAHTNQICDVTATHLLCIDIWREKSGPSLQLLNLVSVIGFMLAPLILKPFLSQETRLNHHDNTTMTIHEQGALNETIKGKSLTSDMVTAVGFPEHAEGNVSYSFSSETKTNVEWAYVTIGVYSLAASCLMLLIMWIDGTGIKRKVPSPDDSKHDDTAPVSKSFIMKICSLFFLFNFFYGGIEVGYAGLVMTFAVRYVNWTKDAGTSLTALVQGSNAAVTASAIIFTRFIRPQRVLLCDIIVILSSLLVLVACVTTHPIILWVTSGLLGAGYATVMPSTFTWVNNFMPISGGFSSAYWCGFFSGFMVVPALSGYLIDNVHPMCFVYTSLVCAICMLIIFLVITFIVNKSEAPN